MEEILLSSASLRTPTNRGGPGADLASDTMPGWVLLDSSAFVLDQRNPTTATCEFMGNKELQVTFVMVPPPNVSYFCACCRGLELSDYAMEPQIVATEADLVLLRIVVGGASGLRSQSSHEYFMYRAVEGKPPSLEHLPRPRPYLLRGDPLGILRYDRGYIILSLGDDASATYREASRGQFEVCLLDSKDKVWTTKPVDLPIGTSLHYTSKVITIGGERGTVAFVDLWRGILLYDVLANDPMLRYKPLPDSIWTSLEYRIDPKLLRDIAVVNGNINYLEMLPMIIKDTGVRGPMVTTYSMPVTCRQEDTWLKNCKIDASKIRDDKSILSPELPQMLTDDERELELTREAFCMDHPTLCLHDKDTVYFLTKAQPMSKKACVIAVSMMEGTIEAVARFGAERTYGNNFTFVKSRISSYLNTAPGTEGAGLKKKKGKGAGLKKKEGKKGVA